MERRWSAEDEAGGGRNIVVGGERAGVRRREEG